ncbi:MAG: hypothetical protein A3D92_13970 [Bacteroidetes bacterium RIFCSPHIGHO2_02_FULL_44_7]|nr:MAG: hypothetical protein A3D92_13970 [Bacteroidetes bacterium RIFCSPHIGHO2_02_FULL_44_7]
MGHMSSNLALEKEYIIQYYPPKSKKAGNQTFLITVLSMCLFIGGVPMLLIFGFEVHVIVAFAIAATCAVSYMLVIQPMLVRRAGDKTEITFNSTAICFTYQDRPSLKIRLADCTFRWYEYSGSDEPNLAGIEIFTTDGFSYKIEQKYAQAGDFEGLLKEAKRQIAVK